jgi:hypothetical protein
MPAQNCLAAHVEELGDVAGSEEAFAHGDLSFAFATDDERAPAPP